MVSPVRFFSISLRLAGAIALGMAGVAACGGDDGPKSIEVELSEWTVKSDPNSVDAGEYEFAGVNAGVETHEFVLVKGDDPAKLPVDADGAVVEDELADGAFIGEIEDIAVDATKRVNFELAAGDYVLFCNVTETEDDGTVESHFKQGMATTLHVK